MLQDLLNGYNIILASASPRRHAFLKALDLKFKVDLKPIDEVYPDHLRRESITDYLSKLKAKPFINDLTTRDILITSDTIVWHNEEALGKPNTSSEATSMIKRLSGQTHEVITSICCTTTTQQYLKNSITEVTFKRLSDAEISYYVDTCKPLDKAGAYGIQEWIGAIGITKIKGSYNNVVGLPTDLLYETLKAIALGN
jgi:septum formation protein